MIYLKFGFCFEKRQSDCKKRARPIRSSFAKFGCEVNKVTKEEILFKLIQEKIDRIDVS